MDNENVFQVVTPGPKNTFQVAIDDLRQRLPLTVEYAELCAKMKRAAYLAYLKEGFTEVQALELCKILIDV